MSELTKNEQDTTAPPTPDVSAAPAPVRQKHHYVAEGFKNRTKGEAKFNRDTYIGVGYFGAIAASLLLTYALKDNKFIAPQFKKLTDWIGELTKGKKTGAALEKHKGLVDSYSTIGSMFTGTTLMTIFPVKRREDHKAEIVKRNDREIYGDAVDTDPAILQAHAEIEAAPKQTWKSVIGSRVLAFVATIGTSVVIGSNASALAKVSGHSIDSLSIRFGRWFDKLIHRKPEILAQIKDAAAHSPNAIDRHAAHTDRLLSRIGSYLALDGFYTVITSGVLYVFTRVLAPVFDHDVQTRSHAEREAAEVAALHARHAPKPQTPAPDGPALSISDISSSGRLAEASERAATI